MHILKFGGTSMVDQATWFRVLEIVGRVEQPVVVVSATARTTRQLVKAARKASEGELDSALKIAHEIGLRHQSIIESFFMQLHQAGRQSQFLSAEPEKLQVNELRGKRKNEVRKGRDEMQPLEQECLEFIDETILELEEELKNLADTSRWTAESQDLIASFGERISSRLLAWCGRSTGMRMTHIDARDVIKTDGNFGYAAPDITEIRKRSKKVAELVADGQVPVIGGFYGENSQGEVTTLGFEGSDLTATLLGAALEASQVGIWTDVSGIFSCDPNKVPEAFPIPELSYREAAEMASFGAKVLHPKTLEPIKNGSIPVYVKNLFEPGEPGTRIRSHSDVNRSVKAVVFREQNVLVTVSIREDRDDDGTLTGLLDTLRESQDALEVVKVNGGSVTLALAGNGELSGLAGKLEAYGEVNMKRNKGLIRLVGARVNHTSEVLSALSPDEQKAIDLFSFNRASGSLTVVTDSVRIIPWVRKIHRTIYKPKTETGIEGLGD